VQAVEMQFNIRIRRRGTGRGQARAVSRRQRPGAVALNPSEETRQEVAAGLLRFSGAGGCRRATALRD